jgi:sortase A
VARRRSAEDLTVDELRQLLIEKRRSERQKRLEHYRRTGRVILVDSGPPETPLEPLYPEPLLSDEDLTAPAKRRSHAWLDRLLFVVEVLAVIGLAAIIFNGVSVIRNLNKEVASALVQPTPSPTPLISAVVLPSGHTAPRNGVTRFNEDEIPEHLRPLVQAQMDIPLPTPGPKNAVRIKVPAISVFARVVLGDGWEELKQGVGQHAGSPDPGENGNIILSAHNDVFGEFFRDLDKLKPGDEVILYTEQKAFTYVVRQTQIVEPTAVEVMAPTHDPVVTLISCYPYLVDNQRIVVTAALAGGN